MTAVQGDLLAAYEAKLAEAGQALTQPHTYLPREPADTQVEAAARVAPKTPTQRQRVHTFIGSRGPMGATDEEIGYALNLSQNSVRPRRLELVEAGLVKDSERRRNTVGGNPAIVWVVVF